MIQDGIKITLGYDPKAKKYSWRSQDGVTYSPEFDEYFEALNYPEHNPLLPIDEPADS